MSRIRFIAPAAAAALVGGAVLIAPAANAASTNGWCSKGSSANLSASAANGSLSVTFSVSGGGAYQPWGVGVADNLTPVFAGNKVTDGNGAFSVTRSTGNQWGTDYVNASAINYFTGEICAAHLPVTD